MSEMFRYFFTSIHSVSYLFLICILMMVLICSAAHYGENFHNLTGSGVNEYSTAFRTKNEYSYLRKDWIAAWQQCLKISQISHHTAIPSSHSTPFTPNTIISDPLQKYPEIGTPPQAMSPRHKISFNNNIPVVVQIAHQGYAAHCHSFINFLFCPSLVYRWSYPTVKSQNASNPDQETPRKINWNNVFYQFLNMCGCLLFVFVCHVSFGTFLYGVMEFN